MQKLLPLAILMVAAGCASTDKQDASTTASGAAANRQAAASPTAPRSALATPGSATGTAGANAAHAATPASRVVYFDFDSSEIKQEYVPLVQSHSRYMTGNAAAKLRIEGSTDERGSREYNLALGERRAQALKRAMTVLGVPAARIETVSYGEEKPAASGHDEASWARNRRDELVYNPR